MNQVVLDASVTVKWLIGASRDEADTSAARQLMEHLVRREVTALQPAHWLVEVAAVLARVAPDSAVRTVQLLSAMQLPVADGPEILRRACELAITTKQHVFDTLYHAVALETPDTVLVTADERYAGKAGHHGRVRLLRDFLADWPGKGR